ncbi:hypothetical protein ABZ958_34720 [Streptomyces sp. NPDC046237]|uniref:hypothetical protein n=1 Tax=Streptomyces sp. NPDC046237 TaxID=3154914 RepID=UPI0034039F4F
MATWHRTCLRLGHRLDERARRAHADAVLVGGDEWACNVRILRLPLLLNRPPGASPRLWVGSRPTQLALTEAALTSFGVRAPRE